MTVYLVGAGPGDRGLMTARSLELIAAADVVIHDRLIPDGALRGARPDAELIYVGKEGGGEQTAQSRITEMLIELGAAGREVVRLKGGDPFVFGRGGEEAEALFDAGIPFEVVPGVSSGIAAPAYAGIPVTHRDAASSVAFVTGHEDPSKPESALDWGVLAAFPGTLIVYMGVRQLSTIAAHLVAGGRDPDQPAALIHRGTLADQRVASGTLATIAQVAADTGIRAPTIAVFGPVAALRERLSWFERRPLSGLSVAITRARAQASGFAARLTTLGAAVVETPVIRTEPLAGPAPDLSRYDLLCLTSPNGVDCLFERIAAAGGDARALADTRIAAIGPGTARRLEAHGIRADIVPERFVAEGLVEALRDVAVERVLIARAEEAREVLPEALRARGAEVDVLPLYRTVIEPLSDTQADAVLGADLVTFSSASTVTNLVKAIGPERAAALAAAASRPRLASIGPVTSAAMREHGLEPDIEAGRHDLDGLVEALVASANRRT